MIIAALKFVSVRQAMEKPLCLSQLVSIEGILDFCVPLAFQINFVL